MQVINDFRHKFKTDGYFKFRTIAVLLAVFFGFCAFWMGLSLFSVIFGAGFFLAGIEGFLPGLLGFFPYLSPRILGMLLLFWQTPNGGRTGFSFLAD